MMTRFVQLLVLSVAAAPLAEAACDAAKYATEGAKCADQAAMDKAMKCATDAGTDVCKALECGMEAYNCAAKVMGDVGCCDDEGMKAAYAAAQKAFDEAMKNEIYKDCSDLKYPACGGAASTTMSAFALLAVMLAKMF